MSKELKKKIGDANAEMIYGEKEKKEFENAKLCHICEYDIKKNNIDHLGNIQKWLKDMRLQNRYPLEKVVKDRNYNPNFQIKQKKFDKAKLNLLKYLKDNKNVIVRDHCHLTGKFRGAAHQQCNLMYGKTYTIPWFFHNFSGYDSHHIFQHLTPGDKTPTVVAKNLEKFTYMEIDGVVMKNSLHF